MLYTHKGIGILAQRQRLSHPYALGVFAWRFHGEDNYVAMDATERYQELVAGTERGTEPPPPAIPLMSEPPTPPRLSGLEHFLNRLDESQHPIYVPNAMKEFTSHLGQLALRPPTTMLRSFARFWCPWMPCTYLISRCSGKAQVLAECAHHDSPASRRCRRLVLRFCSNTCSGLKR